MVKIEELTENDANVRDLSIVPAIPKSEPLELNHISGPICVKEESIPSSSSSSNFRSQFINMGFAPTLVDKVLNKMGENDPNTILETLFTYSAVEKTGDESSSSLEGFSDDDDIKPSNINNREKRSQLLKMSFSEREVVFAFAQLGEDAPLEQLIECIITAQTGGFETKPLVNGKITVDEENNAESLFGVAEKTLYLLQLGFTESEVSSAIENFGPEISVMELADSIFASRIARNRGDVSYRTSQIKTEPDYVSYCPSTSSSGFYYENEEKIRIKRAKHILPEPSRRSSLKDDMVPEMPPPGSAMARQLVPGPPYFLYGNTVEVSNQTWRKLSQFLHQIEPEFVNSQFFSALIRKEGYIHNLPIENRNYIIPKSPISIEDALPFTKKYWPSWDPRKQLNGAFDVEGTGLVHFCEQLERTVNRSQGVLSEDRKANVLHQCKTFNLIWVGPGKLGPVEPTQLERILGYPANHTKQFGLDPVERIRVLKNGYQTDMIGYILSVLRDRYRDGIRVLSVYTGIGGAEVALHRLGVCIKCLVSVEPSDWNRRIVKGWWNSSEQSGELVQIGGISQLTTQKLENYIREFGAFDLVIGGNPGQSSTGGSSGVNNLMGMESTQFFEFVRVLQRVRSIMSNNNNN